MAKTQILLKYWRQRRAMSQQELANKSGVSIMTISRCETGRNVPTAESIKKLAKALKIKTDQLVVDADEKEEEEHLVAV